MNWQKYLALLNWLGPKITLSDFKNLNAKYRQVHGFNDFSFIVQNPKTQRFLLENKTWWKQAQVYEKICLEQNIQLTWPGEPQFPKILEYCPHSPTLLSYKGAPCWNQRFPFCTVGSRKSSPITLSWMDHHLTPFLKKYKPCLLSGGARGIDQKSHSLAIKTKTPALCFLPCGLSHFYPKELKHWQSSIFNTEGAFISPFPPHWSIQKSFFHTRNRLMVCMSLIVFILQAQERSGSMMTARLASDLGLTICTLPGPVMNPLFKGNLKLINSGALMIRDSQDLMVLYQVQKTHSSSKIF